MDNKTHVPRAAARWVRQGGVALAYVVGATLCLRLAVPGTNASAIWVPTGLTLTAVLWFGPRIWPAILLGAFAANGLFLARLGLPLPALLGAALLTALGNTLEAVLAGWAIKRLTGTRHPFDRVPHALLFILFGAVLAPLASALLGTFAFCSVTGRWAGALFMGSAWWLGDAAGALVVVPLLMTFRPTQWRALPLRVHRDALLAVLLAVGFWFGVCPLLPHLAFLVLPLMVLGTFRLGSFYAAALVALLAVLATLTTLLGQGPFIMPAAPLASLLLQQGFVGTLAITTLVLAAALQERRALDARLVLRNRLYRTLSGVNQAIVHAEDRATLLSDTCRLLVDLGGFRMAWIGFKDEASGRLVPAAWAGHVDGYLDDIVIRWDDSPEGLGPSGMAMREERGIIFRDCQNVPAFAPWSASAQSRGYRTSCAFPIHEVGAVTGVLMAFDGATDVLGPEEGRLLEELAGDLGHALGALATRQDLVESERRLRATLENAQLLAMGLALDGTITLCNDHMLNLTGWQREAVLGRSYFQLFLPPEARQAVADRYLASYQFGADPLFNQNEILAGPRGRRLVQWNSTLLRDRDGAVIGTLSLGEDITDQKRAEAALVQRATQLAALNGLGASLAASLDLDTCAHAALEAILASTSPDLALLFLREGEELRLLDVRGGPDGHGHAATPTHQVGACLCGLSARDGQAVYALDIAADTRCTWEECKRAGYRSFAALPLNSGHQVVGVLGLASVRARDFQGQATFLETLAAQLATGIQSALLHQQLKAHAADLERSVAERTALLREANADLAQAVERAMAADRAKSAFLSAMSHELRTPLNSVIGFTGVLLGGMAGTLQPQQVEPLRIVQRNGRHLLDLINDVLDLSKIEASEMRFAALPFDLVEVCREALQSMAPAAAAKGLALDGVYQVETLPMTGDRRRVAQILLNLLSNAVKFTDTGQVTLRLSRSSHVTLAVQDTGPGIAPEHLPRLFREFEQLDVGLARHNEGTGLGLALSRRLARLLNGNIVVESQPGRGSTFTLILPLSLSES